MAALLEVVVEDPSLSNCRRRIKHCRNAKVGRHRCLLLNDNGTCSGKEDDREVADRKEEKVEDMWDRNDCLTVQVSGEEDRWRSCQV
jgi:hypothetical protein